MSNYSVLKQDINNNIYENQAQQITGTVLNAILNEMTASLGAGYQFAGVATLGMNPADPDQRVFYLAGEGIYTNFGGLQVPQGKLGVLKWDFRWTLQTIDGLGGGGANLTGYVSLASTDDLPEEGQPTLGYLCGTNLYLYVGTGGDTKEGKYQNCGSFRGPQGLQGDPGVGIATVTQTTTSTEDEGINVITVTKEDGTQSTFQVRNGSKGSQGIQGPQGVQGEPGRLQAQYKQVETLPTASADTVDYIYLVASQTPNTYDMYYTEENQGAYSWKSLGTTAVQLSDYATKAEVNQLEAKVYIIAPEYFGEDSKQNGQYSTNGDTLVPSTTTAVKQIIDSTARAGDVYALIGQGAFSYNLWAFADADGNILSRSGGNVNALTPIRIVAPVGTTKAIFSSYYASGEKFAVLKNAIFDKDHYILDPLPKKVADNEQAIAQITDAIAVRAWVKKDTSSGQYKPTNQNTGNNGARLSNGTIAAASSSNALVTDLIEIDHTKRYKFKTVIANYFQGIAYYNNGSYIGNDVFHTTGTEQTIEAELTIPENATHFRLATAAINIAYEISTFETLYPQLATKESVDELQEDVETLQANVADLYGIAEAAGTMEVARAVRYIPTKDIYLGADIVSLQGATYDPTYWSVSGGVVKYLGGGGQSTPFVFGMVTLNGQGYLAELTASVASPGFEDLFNIKIGDGALVDTYNGTANTRGGLVSDGGSFTIVPMSTKAFDLTSAKLSPVLSSENSDGYERTVQIEVLNVTAGNSAQTLIDGKWNVAVGPTEYTMAHNVGGSRSVAIGYMALNKWNSGLQNIAIGTFAASNIEEGKYNVCIGADSMWQVKKATGNVVIGRSALGKTGEYAEVLRNVAIGYRAMANQESGAADSVTIGHNANLYGVSRSVFIGSDCTAPYANRNISNVVCIGYGARATKSNQCVLGNSAVSEFVLGNKKLVFNNDNTVSWETIS